MIIQQTRTGRQWGDKRDPTTGTARVGSAKVQFEEFDHWDGPTEAGKAGEYIRTTKLTNVGRMEWPR